MAIQQLFYGTAIPVSAQRHRDISVKTGHTYAFAAGTNSVPLTAVEFGPAAGDYPIVFAGEGESVLPAAILGTRDQENLCVDADGLWTGGYLPAFVRRYPFVFSLDDARSTFTLVIDEEFEGVNRDGRGERLFDSEGAQTGYLQSVLRFLQDYQAQFVRTQAFCQRLVSLNLLVPMQAQFSLAAGERRTLGGFQVVDRDRLKALPDDVLADLCRKDELECIYLHLSSLRHFRRMLERAPQASLTETARHDTAEPPPAPDLTAQTEHAGSV